MPDFMLVYILYSRTHTQNRGIYHEQCYSLSENLQTYTKPNLLHPVDMISNITLNQPTHNKTYPNPKTVTLLNIIILRSISPEQLVLLLSLSSPLIHIPEPTHSTALALSPHGTR